MAATWITIAASSLPEIIRLARPYFTRTPAIDVSQAQKNELTEAQIAELQGAATRNADAIVQLATDMQKTIEVLQVGADRLERRLLRAHQLAAVAITVAILGFLTAMYALGR